jgi:hypothetical protein
LFWQRIAPGAQTPPPSGLAPIWAPSSPPFASATVESLAASSAVSARPSRSDPASVPPLPDCPLHAATTSPQKIETDTRRSARPLIMNRSSIARVPRPAHENPA